MESEWQYLGENRRESFEMSGISALIVDVDETLYPKHHPYHAAGTQGEIAEIAHILEKPYAETEMRIWSHRQELSVRFGRPAAMTETVMSLGITREQWNELRCRVWRPEEWFSLDTEVCVMLVLLRQRYRIAFGTNSPIAVGRRVLVALGVDKAVPDAPLFGSDALGISKPHSDFFIRIAERLGFMPYQCLSIGDRVAIDGTPAIAAGYAGALIVPKGRDAFIAATTQLFIGRERMEV